MSKGTTFKQCGCRDESTGRLLGRKCPKLRRGNGWSPAHGTWYYQLELPPHADGTRRPPLRRGGFATKHDAGTELDQARDLLAIAAPGDTETAIRIADAITAVHAGYPHAARPRPGPQGRRRRPRPRRQAAHRRRVAGGMAGRQEEACGPAPCAATPGTSACTSSRTSGTSRIDRLRVTDIAAVFDHIAELNDAITEARASRSPARRAAVKGRRLVGPATCQRIRATAPLGAQLLHEAASRAPARQRRLAGRAARRRPAQGAGLDRRARPRLAERLRRPARRRPTRAGGRVSPRRHLDLHPAPVPGHGLDPRPDHGLPRRRPPPPAARAVAADHHPGAAPRRKLRAAPPRHRPGRRAVPRSAGRSPSSAGTPSRAPPNPTPASARSPSTPTPSPTSRWRQEQDKERRSRRGRLGRQRVRVHRRDRETRCTRPRSPACSS